VIKQVFELIVGWAKRPGRWPIYFLIAVPALFMFVQYYFESSFRGTFNHPVFWLGSAAVLVITGVAFVVVLAQEARKPWSVSFVVLLIGAGIAVAYNGYERFRSRESVEYVDTYHDEIMNVLTRDVPGTLRGDPRAQALLGEFYEKGLQGKARYDVAKHLYESAAQQGDSRAAINLQLMYDGGRGTEKSMARAFYWKVKASGFVGEKIPAEILKFHSIRQESLDELVDLELVERQDAKRVAVAGPHIELIEPPDVAGSEELDHVRRVRTHPGVRERTVIGRVTPPDVLSLMVNENRIDLEDNGVFSTSIQMEAAETMVSVVAVDHDGQRSEMQFVLVSPSVPNANEAPLRATPALLSALPDLAKERFYALVVGNNEYRHLPNLETTAADAKAISGILEAKYGFTVRMLLNATRYGFLSALNEFRGQLTEHDNLLIYYAGHGEIDRANQRGHWLPVDADMNNTANWISNIAITDILNTMSAKHVMIIADSCYSGTLTRTALARLDAGMSSEARQKWIQALATKRARVVLTSGGVAPVLDGAGGQHSVFTQIILDVLANNHDILEGSRLYEQVAARMAYAANQYRFEQIPQYAPIKYAGHEAGDFLFVPVGGP
jgi:hypothetical protein